MKQFFRVASLLFVSIVLGNVASAQLVGNQRLDTMGSAGSTESDEPELAQADGIFHAVWFEQNVTTNRDLYYSRSLDRGKTWSAPIRLDLDPGVGDQDDPIVLAEANVVVVAWFDDRDNAGEDDVIARVSADHGATFGGEIPVSGPLLADGGDADRIRGAISLPYVHIAFEDDVAATDPLGLNEDIYVASSSNSGASFSAPKAVNRPPGGLGSADIDAPGLAAAGSTVHVTWADGRNGSTDHVYYNRSTDGGVTFAAADVQLDASAPTTSDADETEVRASGPNVYVNWQDNRDDPAGLVNKVYMNASTTGGGSWLGDQRVGAAPAAVDSSAGSFAVSGTSFFIAWEDNRNDLVTGNRDVFLSSGTIGAGSLAIGAEERMDVGSPPGEANSARSRVAVSGDTVFLVYKDSRKDPGGLNDSLYLRVSTDVGLTFGSEIDVTPGLTGADDAEEQNISVSGDILVCLWVDDRNGVGLPRNNDAFADNGCFRVATAASRNGTGINPVILTNTATPRLGSVASFELDCTGFAPNLCGVFGYPAPSTGPVIRYGEVLVDLSNPKYFQSLRMHTGGVVAFDFPLPLDPTFCGFPMSLQGIVFGSPGPQLTNAIDVGVGGL